MTVLGALVAALTTATLCPPLIRALDRRMVIDAPGARSSHSIATPRGGGIAPALGACVGLVVAIGTLQSVLLIVAGLACAFGALGLVDDVSRISAERRLVAQVAIAAGVVPLAVQLGGGVALAALVPAAWLGMVAYVNAFNFMDGINGIAVTQVIVAGAAWASVGVWQDEQDLAAGAAVVAAAALAFLPFNFPRARVFLGDVGSYFLGAWLAAMALIGLDRGLTLEMAVAPLLLYLCDTGVTLVRRIARREPWMEAHRQHTYQRLVVGGWSHARTTAFVAVVIAASSGLGALTMTGSVAVRVIADITLAAIMVGYVRSPSWRTRWAVSA